MHFLPGLQLFLYKYNKTHRFQISEEKIKRWREFQPRDSHFKLCEASIRSLISVLPRLTQNNQLHGGESRGMFSACGHLAENMSFISIPMSSCDLRHTNPSQFQCTEGQARGDVIYAERDLRQAAGGDTVSNLLSSLAHTPFQDPTLAHMRMSHAEMCSPKTAAFIKEVRC